MNEPMEGSRAELANLLASAETPAVAPVAGSAAGKVGGEDEC